MTAPTNTTTSAWLLDLARLLTVASLVIARLSWSSAASLFAQPLVLGRQDAILTYMAPRLDGKLLGDASRKYAKGVHGRQAHEHAQVLPVTCGNRQHFPLLLSLPMSHVGRGVEGLLAKRDGRGRQRSYQ